MTERVECADNAEIKDIADDDPCALQSDVCGGDVVEQEPRKRHEQRGEQQPRVRLALHRACAVDPSADEQPHKPADHIACKRQPGEHAARKGENVRVKLDEVGAEQRHGNDTDKARADEIPEDALAVLHFFTFDAAGEQAMAENILFHENLLVYICYLNQQVLLFCLVSSIIIKKEVANRQFCNR